MAQVLIVEDNGYKLFMVKKALEADGHDVFVNLANRFPIQTTPMEEMDLILINRSWSKENGWNIFNELKEKGNKAAIILYVLQDCNLASVAGLSQTGQEALRCSQKLTVSGPGLGAKGQ